MEGNPAAQVTEGDSDGGGNAEVDSSGGESSMGGSSGGASEGGPSQGVSFGGWLLGWRLLGERHRTGSLQGTSLKHY